MKYIFIFPDLYTLFKTGYNFFPLIIVVATTILTGAWTLCCCVGHVT